MKRLVDAWLVLIGERVVCVCMDDPWYDCPCETCDCKKTIDEIADTWTA